MLVYLNGLMLGLSLIMALGPQNIFLIRQGSRRKHAVLSVFTCFFCDVILICASVSGLHRILLQHPLLKTGITWFGVLFLLYYGSSALKRGLYTKPPTTHAVEASQRWQIIMLALGFSLLNPHAIIDSLIIIGGGSSQFPDHQYAFLLGVLSSSLLWFSFLTIATWRFANTLSHTKVWQGIELASGSLMLFLSLKLAFSQ